MLKCRSNIGVVGAVIASCFVVAGWSSDVNACSLPSDGWSVVLENDELPPNGYVVFSLHCYQNCGSGPALPNVLVRETMTGNEVPGSVEPIPDVDASEHLYGWRATSPLVVGGAYMLEVEGSPADTAPLQVAAPSEPGLETMGLMLSKGPHELEAGDRHCCPSGPINTCGGKYCWYDRVQRLAWVELDWSHTSEPAHFGQYLHRVSWDDGEPGPWSAGLFAVAEFDTARTEYCYTLELKSLIDGSIERVGSACVDHPEGVVIGEFAVDRGLLETQLSVCEAPPAGQEAGWCDARSKSCAEEPRSECDNLEALCAEDDTTGCAVAATGAEPQRRSAWALSLLALAFLFRRARRP